MPAVLRAGEQVHGRPAELDRLRQVRMIQQEQVAAAAGTLPPVPEGVRPAGRRCQLSPGQQPGPGPAPRREGPRRRTRQFPRLCCYGRRRACLSGVPRRSAPRPPLFPPGAPGPPPRYWRARTGLTVLRVPRCKTQRPSGEARGNHSSPSTPRRSASTPGKRPGTRCPFPSATALNGPTTRCPPTCTNVPRASAF